MKHTWVHSIFSLATNSFLYCHTSGEAPAFILKGSPCSSEYWHSDP